MVVIGCCAYDRALPVVSMSAATWDTETSHCLAINVQVDIGVVGREDAVCGSDDWAGGHCVC
jgi:hypothetical protein